MTQENLRRQADLIERAMGNVENYGKAAKRRNMLLISAILLTAQDDGDLVEQLATAHAKWVMQGALTEEDWTIFELLLDRMKGKTQS